MSSNQSPTATSPFSNLNSPAIRSVLEKYSIHFDTHQSNLNGVSADIRAVEAYLKAKNVCLPFEMAIRPRENGYPQYFELLWQLQGASDKKSFRLMVRSYFPHPEVEDGWSLDQECPLIEAPLDVRITLYPYIDKFLESFAKKLKTSSIRRLESEDEESGPVKKVMFSVADAERLAVAQAQAEADAVAEATRRNEF